MSSISPQVKNMIEYYAADIDRPHTATYRLRLARELIVACDLNCYERFREMCFALHGYISDLRRTYWKAQNAEELVILQNRELLAIDLLRSVSVTKEDLTHLSKPAQNV